MDEFVVDSRDGLIAAVKAAAVPTYEEARKNPFCVQWDSARFTFKEGVTERRADSIATSARRIPKRHFEVK
jgi:hypothetical protein